MNSLAAFFPGHQQLFVRQRKEWTDAERRIIFAAAIAIDFDFFENNQRSGGLLS